MFLLSAVTFSCRVRHVVRLFNTAGRELLRISPANEERSPPRATTEHAGDVNREGSALRAAVREAAFQRQAPIRRPWGLRGLPPESGVPVSKIISDFLNRHFPHISSSPTASCSGGSHGPGVEEDTGAADDAPVFSARVAWEP